MKKRYGDEIKVEKCQWRKVIWRTIKMIITQYVQADYVTSFIHIIRRNSADYTTCLSLAVKNTDGPSLICLVDEI